MTVHGRKAMLTDLATGLDATATTYLTNMEVANGNIVSIPRGLEDIEAFEFGDLNHIVFLTLGDGTEELISVALTNQETEQEVVVIVAAVGDLGFDDFIRAVDLGEEVAQAIVKLGQLTTGKWNLIDRFSFEPASSMKGEYGQLHVVSMVFTYRKSGALGA